MKNIIVGITLFNPKLTVVDTVVKNLYDVVDAFVLVDNGSKNIDSIIELIKTNALKKVHLIKNGKNLGVAKALNQIVDFVNEQGAKFALTLDQDSVLKAADVTEMARHVSPDIALICPRMVDINKAKQKKYKTDLEYVDRCITSGTLMNLEVCNKIGKFDELMFIDYVDFEYCKRVRLAGYKILKINTVELKHEIGKRTTHHFLWAKVYPSNHKPERVYYYTRNIYYYLWKFYNKLSFSEKFKERFLLFWKYFSIIIYEKDKLAKLRSYKKGKKDGKYGIESGRI